MPEVGRNAASRIRQQPQSLSNTSCRCQFCIFAASKVANSCLKGNYFGNAMSRFLGEGPKARPKSSLLRIVRIARIARIASNAGQ